MKYLITFPVACILLISACKFYPSGVQRALEKVKYKSSLDSLLDSYRQNPSDSLKLKAAYVLISSLPYNKFRTRDVKFDQVFDSIAKVPDNPGRYGLFEKLFIKADSAESLNPPKIVSDADFMNMQLLKVHIETSFKEWQAFPAAERASFKEFCNYILPYRVTDEPIEMNSRLHLSKKYHWAKELLLHKVPLKTVVDSVLKSMRFATSTAFGIHYHSLLSVYQTEKSRLGVCSDGVNYFVNVFRSIGLIASYEYIPQWGNHHLTGHSWIYVKYNDEDYAVNIMPNGLDLRILYSGESIPKVFRAKRVSLNFDKPGDEDVTSLYSKTITIKYDKRQFKNDTPSLNIFNSAKSWAPVQRPISAGQCYIWNNVGTNVVYIIGVWKNNQLTETTAPFFVKENKQIESFIPAENSLITGTLLRKYGLASKRNLQKLDWLTNLNGFKILASNDSDFKSNTLLYTIRNLGSYQLQRTNEIGSFKRYRYIKLLGGAKPSYLSRLIFFNDKHDTIRLKCIDHWATGVFHGSVRDLFDNSTETYFGGGNLSARFSVPSRAAIISLEFQARTDDNQIRLGDKYELYFWQNGWRSLGKKTASDTVLIYNDIPEKSLLLLKDLTRGAEVHVFTVRNKKQEWLGFLR